MAGPWGSRVAGKGSRAALWWCALAVAGIASSSAPAAAQYVDVFGKNKVRYAKFDWRVYHAPHFDVHYYPEEEHLLEKVISLAESAYDDLSQELDFQIQQPTPFIIYKTHTDFLQNNIIVNFIPEGVGAFATPNLFRMVMPIDLPDNELYALIRHELTHIFQYHILFSGSLGKSLTAAPPQWFMEGMASYYGEDETANDRMFLVDAAVNDVLPPITEAQGGGFIAYRYGHAAFDFIEERWGKDGLRDFLYEFRNTLGARVGRAVERAFRIDPEDFDAEFRRWLRQKYLPRLVETGEPSDFGKPFRTDVDRAGGGSQELSPIASPSGDLVAAFSTLKNDVDLVLFDAQNRRFLRNLTKGGSTGFQNLIAQNLTSGHRMGRDIAFSPDGNSLAVFASKREAGRALVLVDVLNGGVQRVIDMAVEQQMTPAWSPDGKKIAFAGNTEGVFDLFLLDLDTLEIQNVTKDSIFDGSPAFSPDGRLLIFSSVIGEYAQLFVVDLTTGERRRMESGEANDIDPIFSSDGSRIYFTSDRSGGVNNIYSLDIESRQVRQHTNAVTGCFMPAVLPQPDGTDKLVYTGYWNTRFDLYLADVEAPIGELQTAAIVEPGPVTPEDLPVFEPDIQISLDEANKEKRKGFKLFLEDAGGGIGVDDDQTFLGQVYIQFSDFFGDRRLLGIFSSVESFSNFYVNYTDLSRRTQRTLTLFDERDYFQGEFYDPVTGFIERGDEAFQQTGALAGIIRPFSFYRRASVNVGYMLRDVNFQTFEPVDAEDVDPDSLDDVVFDEFGNAYVPVLSPREDDFPIIQASLVGDTTVFSPWGPQRGHRWRIWADYAPNLGSAEGESSTLQFRAFVDARQYVPTSRRSGFAFRFFGGSADGDFPQPFYFGGFDTVRGFEFRELVGDQAFYGNIEWRFPLIDLLATPVLNFQGIRGRVFFDVGGAWFDEFQDFDFYDSDEERLVDAVSAYGVGFTLQFFGLDLHWDFAKTWDFETSSDLKTSFWIGQRF
jgi:Tol biopolymer transport system component